MQLCSIENNIWTVHDVILGPLLFADVMIGRLMTSSTAQLLRHQEASYDVAKKPIMTSSTPNYDVTNGPNMTSSTVLLGRHQQLTYDVIKGPIMTSSSAQL